MKMKFFISGMFQRLEKLRKNAFASMCLFGENNNSTISGIWVWKGQDLVSPNFFFVKSLTFLVKSCFVYNIFSIPAMMPI